MINKTVYQKNRRYMAWCALVMMFLITVAVLIDPQRYAEADSIIMMAYGSLSALCGSYFGFAKNNNDKPK